MMTEDCTVNIIIFETNLRIMTYYLLGYIAVLNSVWSVINDFTMMYIFALFV